MRWSPTDARNEKGRNGNLEVEIPTFVDYVTALVEEAKYGGFLTKEKIRQRVYEEFDAWMSLKVLGRTLVRLGFKWKKRTAQYITKKYSAETLERLRKFAEWCHNNTDYDNQDKLFYWSGGMQVAYSDETFIVSGEFKRQSWVAPHQAAHADFPAFGRNRIAVPPPGAHSEHGLSTGSACN